MNTDSTQTRKIVRCLIREDPCQSGAILNFSLGARPQNGFVVAGLANAYFIRGYSLQDLHRLAEAKKAMAQTVALL